MIQWRFNTAMPALRHEVGERSEAGITVTGSGGRALSGPGIDVPAGRITARIVLSGASSGIVRADIVSADSEAPHARCELDLASLAGSVIELAAVLTAPATGFEVRLEGLGSVHATIVGLEMDLIPTSTEVPQPGRPTGWETRKTYDEKLNSGFWAKYLSGPSVIELGYKGYWGGTVPVVPQAIGVDIGYPGYDGTTLPFADSSVDAIYSSHCLEHIADSKGAIRDWYRVLKVGGFIVIVVPQQFLFERRRRMPSRNNLDHKRFYLPDTLLKEIKEALPENGYRVRHLRENDEGFDYSILPPASGGGLYEIEVVIEKIRKPNWLVDDGSVRPYSAAEFFGRDAITDPFVHRLDLATPGCMLWGPYTALLPAEYEVEFVFEAQDIPSGPLPAPIVFDVAMNMEAIASRTIGLAGGPALKRGRVSLRFANSTEGPQIFEFRIHAPTTPVPGCLFFKGMFLRFAHP